MTPATGSNNRGEGRPTVAELEILDTQIRFAMIDFFGALTGTKPPANKECVPPEMRPAFETVVKRVAQAALELAAPDSDMLNALKRIAEFPYIGAAASQEIRRIAHAAIRKSKGRT